MKIYLAAPWTRREDAKDAANRAMLAGHTITHDWWNHECGDENREELARLAWLDYKGVVNAEVFVVLNVEKSEGKAVEQGVALASYFDLANGPDILIGVGPRNTNIFQNLPVWQWFDTFYDALTYLATV